MATKAEAPDNLYDAAIMLLRSWVAWFDTEPRSVLVANLIKDTRALLREEGQRDVSAADLAPAGESVSREAYLIAQLEKLSLADPCGCEHDNENCCVRVGEPCATCALACLPPVLLP